MTDTNGWISIHRKITKTSFYLNSRALHLSIHLLVGATHAPRQITVGNTEITLLRGQFLGGYKRIAKELGWHKTQARRAVYTLRDAGFLTPFYTNAYSILTIINYNAYQGVHREIPPDGLGDTNGPPGGAQRETTQGAQIDPHTITKIYNNTNKYKDHFETIWSSYPKKVGRKKALQYFLSSVKTDEDLIDIKRALLNYQNSKRVSDGFIMDGKTWMFNWQDWTTNPDAIIINPEFDEIKEGLKK